MKLKNISFLFIFFILLSCSSSDITKSNELSFKGAPENLSEKSKSWNDLALFLGGFPLEPSSKLYNLTLDRNYKDYSKVIHSQWEKIEERNNTVRNWTKEHLNNSYKNNTSLYLLSGADFINLYNFYPDSKNYIMVGMEQPGNLPDPLTLSSIQLNENYKSIEKIVNEMAKNNYFTTQRMRKELNTKGFSGVSLIVMLFMVRNNIFVVDLKKVILNKDGNLDEVDSFDAFTDNDVKGLKFTFYKKNDSEPRTLYFLRTYINQSSHLEKEKEGIFLSKFKRFNLIFKSAEYILQTDKYSFFIQHLLDNSDVVVQDDTGINFKLFDQNIWETKVYGNYEGRVKLSGTPNVPDQKELSFALQAQNQPLPFQYGYGVLKGKDKSVFMIIRRK